MSEIIQNTTDSKISSGTGGLIIDPSGASVVTINNGVLIPDGTKTAPAVRFADDNNTGIYSPVNDQVSITGQDEDALLVTGVISSVNVLEVKPSTTGNPLLVNATGTDTDINVNIVPKGTGVLQSGGTDVSLSGHTHNYQPLDTDLTNIAALTGTAGLLHTDGASTWSVDSSTYSTTNHNHTLDSLSNVNITTLANGQSVKWDTGTSKWVNYTPSSGVTDHTLLTNIGTNTHAQIDSHLANTSNPHSVTASQVSLGSVTNDAQLKRSANDFSTFTEKITPDDADLLLIEDSAASNAKKKLQIGNLPIIYGNNYQIQVSEGETTTTSSTFSTKVSLVSGAVTGTYKINSYCEIMVSTKNKTHASRLYNVTDATELCYNEITRIAIGLYMSISGFQVITFSGTSKTFAIQFASPDNLTTITIRRARLEFLRVS